MATREDIAARYATVRFHEDHPARHEETIRRVYEATLAPGDHAVDGGAHSGKHTVPMAASVGAGGVIYACEPLDEARVTLQRRLDEARVTNVDVRSAALWETSGQVLDFMYFPQRPGVSGLRRRTDGADLEADHRSVTTISLDDLVGPATIRFVKLDVEGAEFAALRGGDLAIRRCRPTVHVEGGNVSWAAYGVTGTDLALWCDDHNYVCFDVVGTPLADAPALEASFGTAGVWDYVLVDRAGPDLGVVSEVLAEAGSGFGLDPWPEA